MQSEMIEELLYWIHERQSIFLAKEAKLPRPWTDDPIIGTYRFCNVYREQDAVSRWLRTEWYEKRFGNDPAVLFAATVARLFNSPKTLEAVEPFVLPFKPVALARAAHKMAQRGERVFNPAYIVSTNGVSGDKVDYLMERVLAPMWAERRRLMLGPADSLRGVAELLRSFNGMAGFMAGQVVADVKYCPALRDAKDWWTFAFSGPGSRRGMNRILGNDPDKAWKEEVWHAKLMELRDRVNERLDDLMEPLHAQDLQNCLCEFDKFRRAKEGGRPKQIYSPQGE